MSNLQALLERVEKAEGPDVDLNEALADALSTAPEGWVKQSNGTLYLSPLAIEMDDDDKGWWMTPAYTGSIDAAVALVEKMLPGRSWEVREQKQSSFPRAIGGQALIMTMPENETMRGDFSARAKTPALALIAALLKALISQSNPERPGVE